MGRGRLAIHRWYWVAIAAALGAAVALTALVLAVDTESSELAIIESVQELPFPGNDLSNLLREATTTELDIAVIGIPLVLVLWFTGHRRHALALVVLLIVLPIAQHEIKEAVDRDRPPFDPEVVWSVPVSRSFPSGHAMSATIVYGWLLYCALTLPWPAVWQRLAIGLSVAVFTLVPLATTYLALHWPTDVLGGYLWGLTLLLPAIWFASQHEIAAGGN